MKINWDWLLKWFRPRRTLTVEERIERDSHQFVELREMPCCGSKGLYYLTRKDRVDPNLEHITCNHCGTSYRWWPITGRLERK